VSACARRAAVCRTGNRSFGSTPSLHPRNERCSFGPSPRGRACANSRYRSHTRRRARDGLLRSDRAKPKKRESQSLAPFRVIGAAMAEAGEVGIGRVTLSRRERPVMVEPRGAGLVLITLRAAEGGASGRFREGRRGDRRRDGGWLRSTSLLRAIRVAAAPVAILGCCGGTERR
jgi:hypothetical protein